MTGPIGTTPCINRATGLLLAVLAGAHAAQADDFFEQQIRPVLVERCYPCHSAQADAVKGGLQLDSAAGLAKGGSSGVPAVVPGDAAKSRLLTAIRYQDPDLKMPPREPLPLPVVEAFERWVLSGAVFPGDGTPVDRMEAARKHWAFQPPVPQTLPEVRERAWPRTEIDSFILSRLEAAGLTPTPQADRRTLIRRLSFDLLGLPPSPEEVAAFEEDPDPEAYAGLVERYLASPQYGERWGRHWLDVARYADTKGYVYGDREEVRFTHSATYRDWVVGAFNRDLPYDQFIRLQLAADQIAEGAERADLAAMGFLTLGQRFIGVMPDIIDDRIDTVSRGLMGLTVSCARCHDHKFDPIPTADYYSLYGVFSASSERCLPLAPEALKDPRHTAFAEEMQKREGKLRERFKAKSEELEARLRGQVDRYLAAIPAADTLPTDDFYEIRGKDDLNPTIVRRWAAFIERQGMDDPVFGLWNRAAAARDEAVSYNSVPEANAALVAAWQASAPKNFEAAVATYAVLLKSVDDEWVALSKTADDAQSPPPERLPDPSREALRAVLFAEGSPIRVPDGAIVDLEWMFDEPARVELSKLQREIDGWIITAKDAPPYTVILVDKPEIAPPHIFLRGSTANHGREVPRQFLGLLAGENRRPFASGSGRRELADAIASADNPLTARVFVNRVWGWHFGAGLVTTPSDFGTRSQPPSHPELLDWLARYFVEQGWSLKQLQRQIVLSATYRQGSIPTADAARSREADSENRLLWHFNAHRLDFESLRDALLFASGELDATPGGRPVDLTATPYPKRRTLYGLVDRQFLPPIFRVFDFPNPDMHNPQRIDTVVPQQALFLMNNPFVQGEARALARRSEEVAPGAARVDWMYERAYQRPATREQSARALSFLRQAEASTPPAPPASPPPAWSYGTARYDEKSDRMVKYSELPHFTGDAWQGGKTWPDAELGWAQLTAEGGHPGNDRDHAVVRRWTAPATGTLNVEGRIRHEPAVGDGITARVVSSRQGTLGTWNLYHSEADAKFCGISVEAGDTLDFVVDIREQLNSDQFLWAPMVTLTADTAEGKKDWNAKAEFAGPYEAPPVPLNGWEKFAQVLLSSNEFIYVD